jgi:hypothetical protein
MNCCINDNNNNNNNRQGIAHCLVLCMMYMIGRAVLFTRRQVRAQTLQLGHRGGRWRLLSVALRRNSAANTQERSARAHIALTSRPPPSPSLFLDGCALPTFARNRPLVASHYAMSDQKPNPGIAGLVLFGVRIRNDPSSCSRDRLTNHAYSFCSLV